MTAMDVALLLSDVDFVRWYVDHGASAEERARWGQERALYDFSLDDDSYHAHYELHEGKFYDGPVAAFLSSDMDKNPRIVRIGDLLRDAGIGARGQRVLDYGCAAGHVTRALARRFPDVQFVGTDVVERGVRLTNAFGPGNVSAVRLGAVPCGAFDAVIASEVLEHVRDPYGLIDRLFEVALRPTGGFLVVTVPWGPWEAQGFDANPGAREHLRHWGCAELQEVFGTDAVLGYDVVAMTKFGVPIGNSYAVARRRAGEVDTERKLRHYRALAAAEAVRVDSWRSGYALTDGRVEEAA